MAISETKQQRDVPTNTTPQQCESTEGTYPPIL